MLGKPSHFLNLNVTVLGPSRIKLSMDAYVTALADKYVPNWRSWKIVDLPWTNEYIKAYDEAHARDGAPSKELLQRYRGKVGALIYTSPGVRVDACAAISRLSRAQTFPTERLDALCDRTIVYLAQTASYGIVLDGSVPNADCMHAESDSDWAEGHSTTGWAIYLAGACIHWSSKRQSCIAMSSTEAEIIAASACALELMYMRTLLNELGLPQDPTVLRVDNSGAVELSRDKKSCHRSRHVDRRYFKVRELAAEGHIRVEHINTDDNSSDLLTKPLALPKFAEHRRRLLNMEG